MQDKDKRSRDQLLKDLDDLRRRVAELEASEANLKQAADELRQKKPHLAIRQDSEEQYRSVVTAMTEGVVMQRRSGEIVACNPAAERILGLTQDQMMGRTSTDPRWRAIHEDGTPFPGETHPAMVTLAAGQAQRDVIMGVHKPDGRLTWIAINSEPMFYPHNSEPYAVVTTFVDITKRKAVEAVLSEMEARYSSLFENMLNGFAYCKMLFDDQNRPLDFVYLNVNSAFERLTGLSKVIGKQVTDLIPGIKEAYPEVFEVYSRVALTGKPERFEIDFRPLGRWFSVSVVNAGKGYFAAIFEDISERQHMEMALQASERKLRQIIEQSGDAIMLVDEAGQVIEWNPAAERLFNLNKTEILGQNVWDVHFRLAPDASQTLLLKEQLKAEYLTFIHAGHDPLLHLLDEMEFQHPDGHRGVVQRGRFSIKTEKGFLLGSILRDVTKPKQAEAERERLIGELQTALIQVKRLSGLLPICASCKKIRDDQGYWQQVEIYIRDHSEAEFSHGICPDCMARLYPKEKYPFLYSQE